MEWIISQNSPTIYVSSIFYIYDIKTHVIRSQSFMSSSCLLNDHQFMKMKRPQMKFCMYLETRSALRSKFSNFCPAVHSNDIKVCIDDWVNNLYRNKWIFNVPSYSGVWQYLVITKKQIWNRRAHFALWILDGINK